LGGLPREARSALVRSGGCRPPRLHAYTHGHHPQRVCAPRPRRGDDLHIKPLVANSAPRPVPNEVHGHRHTGSKETQRRPGRRVTTAVPRAGRLQARPCPSGKRERATRPGRPPGYSRFNGTPREATENHSFTPFRIRPSHLDVASACGTSATETSRVPSPCPSVPHPARVRTTWITHITGLEVLCRSKCNAERDGLGA
jgi:hypothetical protein